MSHRLAELLGALSLATDAANGVAPQTCMRTAIIAAAVAERAGLSASEQRRAYYGAQLRFLGCTGFAHETAMMARGDDRSRLRALMTVDGAAVDPTLARTLASAHCSQAMALAEGLGVGPDVVRGLGQIYERWDGRGAPAGLRADRIDPAARVVHVAFRAEAHRAFAGPDAAIEAVSGRSAEELDPDLSAAFTSIARGLLVEVSAATVWERFLAAEREQRWRVEDEELDGIAAGFARYSDLKSPFTLGHSSDVAALCVIVGRELGVPAPERSMLRRAGLLHDLGRVAVANGIWDKPGALTRAERELVESHSAHTERILRHSTGFRDIARIAGAAHERLDGGGYHRGVGGLVLDDAPRVLAACDVYVALGAARAHRPAHGRDEVAALILEGARRSQLCPRVVEALLDVQDHGSNDSPYPDALSSREVEVLGELARGRSNKQIAQALTISSKTVQHHLTRIYAKTGVDSRVAAALYAVTRGLIGRRAEQ